MAQDGPYHEGERAVQERAEVGEMARRIGRGIRDEIPAAAAAFLAEQRFAVLGWRDDGDPRGGVWASPMSGEPGFMAASSPNTVAVRATLAAGDPLAARARPPSQVGLIAIDFATRRRMRVNGEASGELDRFELRTRQVYSNCPKYIQARELRRGPAGGGQPLESSSLSAAQAALVTGADTFFIATHHESGGADASHRGGRPGFVHVSAGRDALSWPDYPGNNMFQTLGNLVADGRAGLLFIDFDTGSTLQLSGSARTIWEPERVVDFHIDRVVELPSALPLRWRFLDASPFNP
jgi:predicted pyridoxine 5'-phosphate oxidase superfamily flavin-nucleotide-binding protein